MLNEWTYARLHALSRLFVAWDLVKHRRSNDLKRLSLNLLPIQGRVGRSSGFQQVIPVPVQSTAFLKKQLQKCTGGRGNRLPYRFDENQVEQ